MAPYSKIESEYEFNFFFSQQITITAIEADLTIQKIVVIRKWLVLNELGNQKWDDCYITFNQSM